MKLQYGDVVVRAERADGIVSAVVDGVVNVKSAAQIIGDAKKWAPRPLAQVVSYKAARIDLGADALFRAAVQAHAADTPTALVVPPDQFEMFRLYVRMHVERGVLKAAFTSEEKACQWAAQQAAVRGYWQRLTRSRQSSP